MMKLVENTPIGTRRSMAHINRGPGKRHEWREVDWPEYAPTDVERGRRFREARLSQKLTLREVADVLGVRASEISALEFGWKRPADDVEEAKFYAAVGARR